MNHEPEQRYLINRTYDEIQVGDSASLTRILMPEDVKLFAILTGDLNPAMVDPTYSQSGLFREVIAHGMWSGSLISTVLGTQFPGPGTILIDQSLHFARPVTIGDSITITVTAKQKFDHNKHIIFDCVCTNQDGLQVVRGNAEVLAPEEKISRLQEVHMPEIRIDDKHERYVQLLERVRGLEPIPTAVAHPCDESSLRGAVEAAELGILQPVLVGTAWLSSMFDPAPSGLMSVTGAVVGGHEYVLVGLDVEHKHVIIRNGWGVSWGLRGFARITWADFGRLLKQDGEAATLSVPAPVAA